MLILLILIQKPMQLLQNLLHAAIAGDILAIFQKSLLFCKVAKALPTITKSIDAIAKDILPLQKLQLLLQKL